MIFQVFARKYRGFLNRLNTAEAFSSNFPAEYQTYADYIESKGGVKQLSKSDADLWRQVNADYNECMFRKPKRK